MYFQIYIFLYLKSLLRHKCLKFNVSKIELQIFPPIPSSSLLNVISIHSLDTSDS